jgi:tetratricopeptide (TPR) repeat protein
MVSKRGMSRRAAGFFLLSSVSSGVALAILILTVACSSVKPPASLPDTRIPARLTSADALVRAGCVDCLLNAYKEYDALRSISAATDTATAGAIRTALLIAIRERELGTEDTGYVKRARELLAGTGLPLQEALSPLLDIADALPTRGAVRQVGDDVELARMQAAYRNREAWTALLRAHADDDPLSAYLWLGFNCAYVPTAERAVEEWLKQLPVWRETALIAFKAATCGTGGGRTTLEHLLESDPRFLEINYFLAMNAAFGGHLDEAIERLQRAYTWRPRWPALTNSLAIDYIAIEEFDPAVDFFDRTLALAPNFADALLGKARALTYAGRHEDALTTIDQLLALGRWLIGDARYWRALNEAQLGRNEEAWSDIELAAKLLVNAEVPKLAGIVSYRLKQIDVSRAKFEESWQRNPLDCETGYYLGIVAGEQGVWPRTADVLVDTDRCLQQAERNLTAEIAAFRRSTERPERRERQIAKREQQIATGRRMMATSWFNIAVAYYNLSREDDARQYAEKVSTDEQFGDRARDLLARLR